MLFVQFSAKFSDFSDNPANFIEDLDFIDKQTGVALTYTGTHAILFFTEDGGETWQIIRHMHGLDFGVYNYRVEMESKSSFILAGKYVGVFRFQETADIFEMKSILSSLYPNPATPGKLINLDIEQGQFTGKIFDINGEIVQRPEIAARSFYLSPDIAPGVYLLLIESAGEVIAREKFIVK